MKYNCEFPETLRGFSAMRFLLLTSFAYAASNAFMIPRPLTAVERYPTTAVERHPTPQLNFLDNMFKELDNFLDDATSRRLGNGAAFYGKRKSGFYGDDDSMRKEDAEQYSKEEDYSGPAGGSYFVLSKERDEQGRPMGFLTRKEAREQAAKEEAELSKKQGLIDAFKDGMQQREDA